MKNLDIPRSVIEAAIEEWVLNERDRAILKRRFCDGVCFEPLAFEFNLSVRQVQNIVYKQGEKMMRHLPIP